MPLPTSYHPCAHVTFTRTLNQDEVNRLLGSGFTGVRVGSNGCQRDHYDKEMTARALLELDFVEAEFSINEFSTPDDNSWM